MATRNIKEIEIENLKENMPFVNFTIGTVVVRNPCLIDDTMGPHFKINLVDKEINKKQFGAFIHIQIRAWDASQNQLKARVYKRTLLEYDSSITQNIFRRYRAPFDHLETFLYNKEYHSTPYIGNPKANLTPGDIITIEILAPWKIDIKTSKIILEIVELRGHVGPEQIKVSEAPPIRIIDLSDRELVLFYSWITGINQQDIYKSIENKSGDINNTGLTIEKIKSDIFEFIDRYHKIY